MNINDWLIDAKRQANSKECGMYLIHNGVVRSSSRIEAREGIKQDKVKEMNFSYDHNILNDIIIKYTNYPGIKYLNVWLNEGRLKVGDDLMYILVGGDIRNNCINCLNEMLSEIKNKCVKEEEIF